MPSTLPWEPAIYEHKAALIHETPGAVARSETLLRDAVMAEHAAYQADFITLGIDIYNIEAEAIGARVVDTGPTGCPEIGRPLFDLDALPDELPYPAFPDAGRCRLILNAGQLCKAALPARVALRVGASGPASIAAKLVGLQNLIMALASGEEDATRLLAYALDISTRWTGALRDAGLDVLVFDSVCAPPMMSPRMYEESVFPLHETLMRHLAVRGQTERALIIGGDTTPIAACLARTGATTLLCDFPAHPEAFAKALPCTETLTIRRNVSPAIFTGDGAMLQATARTLAAECRLFPRPIAGTGILPYDTDPRRVCRFRDMVRAS